MMQYRDWKPESKLLGYQRRWVMDQSRLKLVQKSRQVGFSWATAYGLVRRKARDSERLDAWISSRDEQQARLFKRDCDDWAGVLAPAARDLGELLLDPEQRISAHVLEFAHGVRLNCMSSNPNAQAGKRGDRVLDEFALHADPRTLWAIAYPGITWGGSMEVISTHRGSGNLFNELVREIEEKGNPKGISLHTVTLQDALEYGFLAKLKEKLPRGHEVQGMDEGEYYDFIRAGCVDEESWQQEYCCKPADDKGAFLEYGLLAQCEYPSGTDWEVDLATVTTPLYVGVDIGRDHDLTVIWVGEMAGGRLLTRRVIELGDTPFSEQEAVLYPLLQLPRVQRCCIDCTGIGRQFAERAQEKFGSYRVEAVNFSGPVKEELAYPLRGAFEDRNLLLPLTPAIKADLRAVKKETTAAGNIRFAADRGKNGHSDRFWALALCWHAASSGHVGPVRGETFGGERDAARRERRMAQDRNRPDHSGDDRRERSFRGALA